LALLVRHADQAGATPGRLRDQGHHYSGQGLAAESDRPGHLVGGLAAAGQGQGGKGEERCRRLEGGEEEADEDGDDHYHHHIHDTGVREGRKRRAARRGRPLAVHRISLITAALC
jgi:hypothetical protein